VASTTSAPAGTRTFWPIAAIVPPRRTIVPFWTVRFVTVTIVALRIATTARPLAFAREAGRARRRRDRRARGRSTRGGASSLCEGTPCAQGGKYRISGDAFQILFQRSPYAQVLCRFDGGGVRARAGCACLREDRDGERTDHRRVLLQDGQVERRQGSQDAEGRHGRLRGCVREGRPADGAVDRRRQGVRNHRRPGRRQEREDRPARRAHRRDHRRWQREGREDDHCGRLAEDDLSLEVAGRRKSWAGGVESPPAFFLVDLY